MDLKKRAYEHLTLRKYAKSKHEKEEWIIKKRILAALLAVAMLACSLAACATSDTPSTTAPSTSGGSTADTAKTTEPASAEKPKEDHYPEAVGRRAARVRLSGAVRQLQ